MTAPVAAVADKNKASDLAFDLSRPEAAEYVNDSPKPEDLAKAGLDHLDLLFASSESAYHDVMLGSGDWNKTIKCFEAIKAKDWDKAVEEVRKTQVEWRATGPVRKKQADGLWERFQQACAAVGGC